MKLDNYQKEAIDNKDDKVLLVAPPGSGKTTVLVEKISNIISEGIDPNKIVVLTFSKGAAINMKDRFNKKYEISPFFGTVHSFCYKMIRKYTKNKKAITIINNTGVFKSLEPIRLKYSLSHEDIVKASSELSKNNKIDSSIAVEESDIEKMNNGKRKVESSYPKKFIEEMSKEYESYKKENGFLDFNDLEDIFIDLIRDESILYEINQSIDYILVDEFQDLNDKQILIIQKIIGKAKLFCVGDEDQCIYAFRGSNTKSMTNFEDYFKNGIKLYLKYNYRSYKSIIDYANKIIKKNKERNNKIILSSNETYGVLEYKKTENEYEQYREVIDFIKNVENTNSSEDIAILYRTNTQSVRLSQELYKASISFSFLDRSYNHYHRFFIKEIITFLSFNLTYDFKGIKEIQSKTHFSFSEDSISKLEKSFIYRRNKNENIAKEKPDKSIKASRKENLNFLQSFVKILKETKSDRVKNQYDLLWYALLDIKEEINIDDYFAMRSFFKELLFLKEMSIDKAIDYILYGFCYVDYLMSFMDIEINTILKEINEFKKEIESFNSFESFYKYFIGYNRFLEAYNPKSRVLLSTLHSVKGMEFDNVIIIDLFKGSIPHEKSLEELEAERRLFYVGVTRAKKNLLMIYPKLSQAIKREESNFIEEDYILC